jgi:predicted transcriptional regulator
MARLQDGEREERENIVLRLLKRLRWGSRESDMAEELGWGRRTVNNYLHDLEDDDKVYKEGRSWFAKKK